MGGLVEGVTKLPTSLIKGVILTSSGILEAVKVGNFCIVIINHSQLSLRVVMMHCDWLKLYITDSHLLCQFNIILYSYLTETWNFSQISPPIEVYRGLSQFSPIEVYRNFY